MRNQWDR